MCTYYVCTTPMWCEGIMCILHQYECACVHVMCYYVYVLCEHYSNMNYVYTTPMWKVARVRSTCILCLRIIFTLHQYDVYVRIVCILHQYERAGVRTYYVYTMCIHTHRIMHEHASICKHTPGNARSLSRHLTESILLHHLIECFVLAIFSRMHSHRSLGGWRGGGLGGDVCNRLHYKRECILMHYLIEFILFVSFNSMRLQHCLGRGGAS